MFCDELKIKVIAGKGGDGCVSFRREKFIPKGGPDGGDGGHGGDVIIKVNPHLNTLSNLTNGKVYKAPLGVNGKGKNMHGKNANDLILEVPKGTVILNADKSQQLADLNKEDDHFTIAKGGQGGHGNARFVSSVHQVPRFAENGEPGEEKEIILELKLVADLGIIGLPSAGKSTLISVISNAKPKIAAYHFTTLIPNLGIVNMDKFGGSKNDTFAVADIPGLIEGASQGKGLGHEFLKHISRTKLLLHLLDGSSQQIEEDYKVIRKELKTYDPKLDQKEEIIAISKVDLLSPKELEDKTKKLKKVSKHKNIFKISAPIHEGLSPLLHEVSKKLIKIKHEELEQAKKIEEEINQQIPIIQPHLEKEKFKIEKIIKKQNRTIFRVSGKRIEQIIVMTDIKNPEGLERIYHYFNRLGIQDSVNKKGAKLGDTIRINDKDIPYRP